MLLTGLDDVLSRLEQVERRPSRVVPRLVDISDTSGNENDLSDPPRKVRSKRTYKTRTVGGASDASRFLETRPTDAATKSSRFHCCICRKDISILTLDHNEVLRHVQGSKCFPRDQRLSLETRGCEVLDDDRNAKSPAEVDRQRERIVRALLVMRDRE